MQEHADSAAAAETVTQPELASIHERMVAILAALPAIGKDSRNPQQGFMFRSHDAVLNALNPLLGAHGVYVVPNVLERLTAQRKTARGGIMYEVNLHVEFTFYGLAGDYVVATTWGEGTDSGDKSTNKAMTMAFKNALNQVFAVSTEETRDADFDTDEPTVGRVEHEAFPDWERPENLVQILERLEALQPPRELWTEYWLPQAIQALYGAEKRGTSDLDQGQRNLLGQKLTTVLYELEHVDVTFLDDAIIATAFSRVLDGTMLAGPPPPGEIVREGEGEEVDPEVEKLAEQTITGPENGKENDAD